MTAPALPTSLTRLHEVAKEQRPPVVGKSAIARWLNESPQSVNNWEKRGVSKQAALKVQSLTGVSATWLLSGRGTRGLQVALPLPPTTAPPPPPPIILSAEYRRLLDDLEDIPPKRRSALLDHIHQIAEEAREAHAHLTKSAHAHARRESIASRMTVKYGDGNARQRSLPLSGSVDPFTAAPSARERALYDKIARTPK